MAGEAGLPGGAGGARPVDAATGGDEPIVVGLVLVYEAVADAIEDLACEELGEVVAEVFELVAGGEVIE